MTKLLALVTLCFSFSANAPELKPDRIIDTWEITNSDWDQETFTFSKNRSFAHLRRDGKTARKQTGHWSCSKAGLTLTLAGGQPATIEVRLAKRPEEDALVFGPDTLASRQSLVTERRLATKLFPKLKRECIEYKEPSGSAYRVFFRDLWPSAWFDVVLWPRSQKDADRLARLALADLRKRGFTLKHRVEIERQGY